jgi:hypothetical protein
VVASLHLSLLCRESTAVLRSEPNPRMRSSMSTPDSPSPCTFFEAFGFPGHIVMATSSSGHTAAQPETLGMRAFVKRVATVWKIWTDGNLACEHRVACGGSEVCRASENVHRAMRS